jgi:hypothetical protein
MGLFGMKRMPYSIRREGYKVYVEWSSWIGEWSESELSRYRSEYSQAVQQSVSSEVYSLLMKGSYVGGAEYLDYINRVRTLLIEEYQFEESDVGTGNYHGGMTVIDFKAPDPRVYPYNYMGVRLVVAICN